MAKLPKISVNIPLITDGDNTIVLESLKKIDYPKNLFEIVIVEGNQISKQRNVALENSSGTIIYLLDDDSVVHPKSFKLLAKEFSNPKIGAVGGPSLVPQEGDYFNKLVGYVLATYFGATRMKFKWSKQTNTIGTDHNFIGSNLALRRRSVMKVGKFNERIIPNEETELLRRLHKAGYTLKYNQKLYIYRDQRKNIFELAKQFHHYGTGRMKQTLYNFSPEDVIFIIPIGFLFYLISLVFFHLNWYFIPLVLYILLGLATSLKASIKHGKPDLLLTMMLIYPIIHLSYALGLLSEFLASRKREEKKKKQDGFVSKITLMQLK